MSSLILQSSVLPKASLRRNGYRVNANTGMLAEHEELYQKVRNACCFRFSTKRAW